LTLCLIVHQALASIAAAPQQIASAVGDAIAVGLPVLAETGSHPRASNNGDMAPTGARVGGADFAISMQHDADLALAMQLQAEFEEEDRQARLQQQHQANQVCTVHCMYMCDMCVSIHTSGSV
jgi:hypothetical protein